MMSLLTSNIITLDLLSFKANMSHRYPTRAHTGVRNETRYFRTHYLKNWSLIGTASYHGTENNLPLGAIRQHDSCSPFVVATNVYRYPVGTPITRLMQDHLTIDIAMVMVICASHFPNPHLRCKVKCFTEFCICYNIAQYIP